MNNYSAKIGAALVMVWTTCALAPTLACASTYRYEFHVSNVRIEECGSNSGAGCAADRAALEGLNGSATIRFDDRGIHLVNFVPEVAQFGGDHSSAIFRNNTVFISGVNEAEDDWIDYAAGWYELHIMEPLGNARASYFSYSNVIGSGGDANIYVSDDVMLTTVVTPVPAALPLAASALASLGGLSWLKRRRTQAEVTAAV